MDIRSYALDVIRLRYAVMEANRNTCMEERKKQGKGAETETDGGA